MSTIIIIAFCLAALTALIILALKKPTGIGNWSLDQAVLPFAEINGDIITLHNVRNFHYRSTSDFTPQYYDKTVKISDLSSVDFIVEPFSGRRGVAHTFVSFEFIDGSYISISVEVRKKQGEHFDAFKGLFRHFELMYVIADERDVIQLRSNFRKDNVYLYPIKTTPEKIQKMFLEMIQRANSLKQKPEFYNTITNTCTTNLVRHINTITPKRVPWSLKILIPTYSDKLAYDVGLIDNSLPFEQVKP
ncbi:TPA: hypothetical protein DCQ44_00030, partial [Candidatus Taylorbacteria bacterium]|nr:hypothetical protein [Candidatus Taylorbacteria bacterium]